MPGIWPCPVWLPLKKSEQNGNPTTVNKLKKIGLAHMGQAHMGQGPYGPIWVWAHMGLGPYGPIWVGSRLGDFFTGPTTAHKSKRTRPYLCDICRRPLASTLTTHVLQFPYMVGHLWKSQISENGFPRRGEPQSQKYKFERIWMDLIRVWTNLNGFERIWTNLNGFERI